LYLVEVAEWGRAGSGGWPAWVLANLRAWYSFRRMGRIGGRLYYIVGDDASLALFREALEALGFKVARVVELGGGPWYVAGFEKSIAEDAAVKELAREAFSLLREAGWPARGARSVREVAVRVAEERGLNPDKVYRTFLYALEKLSNSVILAVRARGIDSGALGRLAVRVGLVPLKEDASLGYTLYSGRFMRHETEYDSLLRELGGVKLVPATLVKELKSLVEREYGADARYVFRALSRSKAFQVLLARAKAGELERLVREARPDASITWRIISVNLRPGTLKTAVQGAGIEAGRAESRESRGLPAS